MAGQPSLQRIVGEVLGDNLDERDRAVALHDYVRDAVPFGINRYFDAATPEQTLVSGRGHGNAKSRLMAALFRAAGFECYQHFAVIPKRLLEDAIPPKQYWLLPNEISHSYVDVRVGGWWSRIDSYVLDTSLLLAGTARLQREGRKMGYGVRLGATNTWKGQGDAFSQFSDDITLEDHGRVEDPETYFQKGPYRNKILGIPVNTIFRLMGSRNVESINDSLDRIRRLGWVERSTGLTG